MRIYTVHLTAGEAPTDALLIKEGFSWPAFIFSALWALWHRMWWVALILVGLMVGLGLLMELAGLDEAVQGAASFGLAVIIGGMANDFRRSHLARRGFSERAVIAAGDREAALYRYLEVARTHRAPAQ
jgi:hypothetical protein